jgi:hypothetical protein
VWVEKPRKRAMVKRSLGEPPQNNGMKLTARGASVEARQLIPVFGGRGEHG